MTEDQCATALFETLQIIKKHLGTEKTIGIVTQSWEKFQEQLKQRG